MAMSARIRQDKRGLGVLVSIGAIVGLGLIFSLMPRIYNVPESTDVAIQSSPDSQVSSNAQEAPPITIESPGEAKLHQRFQQAVLMLHSGQYNYAITALHDVLRLAPKMPEAHVNMGFALIGLENYKGAMDFFDTAIELNPEQANAYYGMAVALDAVGNRRAAVSAMNLYLHLADAEDPFIRKAQAALWEWGTPLESVNRKIQPGETSDQPVDGVINQ